MNEDGHEAQPGRDEPAWKERQPLPPPPPPGRPVSQPAPPPRQPGPPPGWQLPPGGQPQVVYVERQRASSTLGVLALVAGLIGFAVALGPRLFAVFALAAGLTALVIGIVAIAKGQGRGMAVAGVVLGVLAVLIAFWSMAEMDRSFRQLEENFSDF
jgi:hypothetical protein